MPGSIGCLGPAPRLHTVIVSRFAIVTEELVICCYQVTKFFSTRYGSAIASSAWGPCNFGRFYRSRKFGLQGNGFQHCVYPNPHGLLNVGSKDASLRRTGVRVSVYWNFIIHQIFFEFLQPPPGFQSLHDLSRQTTGRPVPSTTCLPVLSVVPFLLGL